jgi:hypothetical protein
VALDRWTQAAGVSDGRLLRALNKDGWRSGRVRTERGYRTDGNLTPQAIYNIVAEHIIAAGSMNRKS